LVGRDLPRPSLIESHSRRSVAAGCHGPKALTGQRTPKRVALPRGFYGFSTPSEEIFFTMITEFFTPQSSSSVFGFSGSSSQFSVNDKLQLNATQSSKLSIV
jgi:hypothetical protein